MQSELARVLDELEEVQLRGLATVASLIGSVVHEVNNPLGAIASAADVNSRCVQRLRAITASVKNVDELRKNAQFERALDLLEKNSLLVAAATESIGQQVRTLREFARTVPQNERATPITTIVEDVLLLLEHETKRKLQIHKDLSETPPVSAPEPLVRWMLLECVWQAVGAAESGELEISTRSDESAVMVVIEFQASNGSSDFGVLREWVKRAGGDLQVDSTDGSRTKLQLRLRSAA